MIWFVPLLPALVGGAIWASGGRATRRTLAAAGVAGVAGSLVLAIVAVAGRRTGAFGWGAGLELTVAAEGLSRVMAVLVPVIAAPVVAYAAFHEAEHGLARLTGLLTAFVGAMELLVLADDLLTLLIGWELVGLLSWALIGFEWREVRTVESAGQAFVPTRFGDLGLFLAAGAAFAGTGSLRFDALGRAGSTNLAVVAAGILLAAAAKSGQLPFSPWLFSAMAGPTPVSALLHSATMIAAGAYALARLEPMLSPVPWFGGTVLGIGLATALAGGVVALVQDHGKRVLAASTSAQYGLMFVAVGAGFPGAAGAHLVTQAFFKALLFLAVGVAMQAVGTGDIHRMHLGRALPAVAGAALVGSLALAAVPPLGAAWSKEAIVAAAAEDRLVLALAVAVAGLLSAAYATRLQLLAFGRDGASDPPSPAPTRVEVAAVAALAAGTVALSVLWIPGGADRVARITGGRVPEESLGLAATGIVAVVAGALLGRALARRDVAVPAVWADWLGIPVATKRLVVDPALAGARALAAFDGRVVDAGVRGAGRIGDWLGRALARRDRLTVDALVEAIGRGAFGLAGRSGRADDRVVDRSFDRLAVGVGAAGRLARRAQTGMAHHYLLVIAAGVVGVALLAAAWR
ncbi:MAG: NADH-quinone oxidoreductase subunit L [Actinobacteria bacterium]|nr:NADH-quinone oxidoreductase subunit L [Actinomycetota bacterium]